MAERFRELPKKILEWWNKFNPRQKTIMVSAAVAVILAISILTYSLTRPQYTTLVNCESAKEASEITALFDSNNITYKISTDATSISVLTSQVSDANLLLGANDIPTLDYSIEKVTEGGFSTTESDKQKRYIVYKEDKLKRDLEANELIKNARVSLTVPEDDGTLIAQNMDSFASVVLELDGEMTDDMATALAHFIATVLGNATTDNVTIIDTMGNLLYSGETQAAGTGNASTQLTVKQEAENLVKNQVKSVLLGTNLYDSIEVASNLQLDFASTNKTTHTYDAPEGQTQGVLASEDVYTSESTGGVAGVPGTDSNDNETTYVIDDNNYSSQTVSEESRKYLPYETITSQEIPPGLIKYEDSSISVTCKTLKLYKEEEVKDQGLLVDMNWEQFQAANQEQVKLDVDEDMYAIVHTATGIPNENITIVAYEVPVFLDKEGANISATDIVTVILIIAILGVLAFVVMRSMRTEKEEQPEEELSVESLLQSTPDEELEDIELEGKSEARKLIEKFVDENPEAVANLLRNWLTEDWG